MRYRQDAAYAMARVRFEGHAHGGQEGHVDSQDKPHFGSTPEW
jgi:hypothetical protein